MAARRPPHKVAHAECPYAASNWAECDARAQEVRGRCMALTEKESECTHWAVDTYDDRPYCGVHFAGRVNAGIAAKAAATRKADMNARIDAYLEAQGQVAHVCGERCPFSGVDEPVPTTPVPVSLPPGVIWSARSGRPRPPVQSLRQRAPVRTLT